MRSLPISQIFSGSNHSGCLTHSGAIFVWGKNNFGQLGTGNSDSSQIPILLKTIRDRAHLETRGIFDFHIFGIFCLSI